jgi:hypothetical protein
MIEAAQQLDPIYTAKKLGLFRGVLEDAIEDSNPAHASGQSSRRWSVSDAGGAGQSGPASFVLDIGEATKRKAEQKRYGCPLLGTQNLWLDSALHLAVRYEGGGGPRHDGSERDHGIVSALLQFGAPVDLRNKWQHTPLHEAARAKSVNIVGLLLQYGADPLMPDSAGDTALHICAAFSDEASVPLAKLVLDAVPDDLVASVARLRNKRGNNPVTHPPHARTPARTPARPHAWRGRGVR